MKKLILIAMFLILTLTFFVGCGGNNGLTGSGSTEKLLKFIPEDVTGYLSVDVKGLSKFDIFKDIEKDFKSDAKSGKIEGYSKDIAEKIYQDFIEKTGMDLKKDISSVVAGFYGSSFIGKKDMDFVLVAGIKHNKEKLLKFAKEEGGKFKEETYDGMSLYNVEDEGKNVTVSFPDDSHIIVASTAVIKKAVDLFKGKGKSVLQNEKQKSYLKMINDNALVSVVFNIPEQSRVKQNVGMGEVDFTKTECFVGSAWKSGSAFEIDLKLLSKNKEGNEKIVKLLETVKMFGAMNPDFKELLDGLNINSDENTVHLTV